MLTLAKGDLLYPDAELIDRFRRTDPGWAGLFLVDAHRAVLWKDYAKGLELLQQAIRQNPDLIEAHARAGQAALEVDSEAELKKWYSALPPEATRHPSIWNTLGTYAERHGQSRAAVRCFWEAIRIDPNLASANYQLGQILITQDRKADAKPFLARAELLQQYALMLDPGAPPPAMPNLTIEVLEQTTQLAESLGLIWEAYSWSVLASGDPQRPRWAVEARGRLQRRLPGLALERAVASANPASTVDLGDYPLPDFTAHAVTGSERSAADTAAPGTAARTRFRNDAASAGLEFRYHNGSSGLTTGRERPYEFTGGGCRCSRFRWRPVAGHVFFSGL